MCLCQLRVFPEINIDISCMRLPAIHLQQIANLFFNVKSYPK